MEEAPLQHHPFLSQGKRLDTLHQSSHITVQQTDGKKSRIGFETQIIEESSLGCAEPWLAGTKSAGLVEDYGPVPVGKRLNMKAIHHRD